MFKAPLGTTPYRLVYGKACHLPVEIEYNAYWALRAVNLDYQAAGKLRFLQLNELDEWCQMAYENIHMYKEKSKLLHDSRIKHPKQFKEGDLVLLYNSRLRLFPRKLKSKWLDPFTVKQVFSYGVVEVEYPKKGTFKVNGQRLKLYHGEVDFKEGKEELRLLSFT